MLISGDGSTDVDAVCVVSRLTENKKSKDDLRLPTDDNLLTQINCGGIFSFEALKICLEEMYRQVGSQFREELQRQHFPSSMVVAYDFGIKHTDAKSHLCHQHGLLQKHSSDNPQTMSPSTRNSRIVALENMLATSSSSLVSMASQLSEVEERECVFGGRGRWNQVRSIVEAKNLMNYLFNLASSSR
ncbi:uncharacterized protein A4U43_C05F14270 [Asparagus officinalis]|uniref:Uncharacterized protein n=1 Tax=Asparagus officinalis TaxID=4686 RepID=A0A5P1ERJ9_ASPOF|nr:uncharacterized protein A4U43_C05F14270 [Asparagus officinalis]